MSTTLSAPPLQSNFIDPPDNPKSPDAVWALSRVAVQWLLSLTTRIQTSATLLKTVSLTAQSASISTTPIPLGTITAGLYRIAWHTRITTAATTSSSLTVSIAYTESGVACSQSGAALTTNTTSSVQSGVILVKADQATSISYSTTYASVGGTAMVFKIDICAELLS